MTEETTRTDTGPEAEAEAPAGEDTDGDATEVSAEDPAGDRGEEATSAERGTDGDGATSPEKEEERAAEEELAEELDALETEFQALNDRHLRLAAEFQNYRRRAETEMTEAWGRAQADLVRTLVEALDDLQRVSDLDPADEAVSVESIVEGVDLVERKFLRALEEAGVEVVDPEGEPFDPETMEAMMRAPAESEEEDDTVAQVFQKGYVMKGHLIRPARVSVKKHG